MNKSQKAASDLRVMEMQGFSGFSWKAAAVKKAESICSRIDKRKGEGARLTIELGRDLCELKAMCQHGEFIPAVEVRLGMSYRSAKYAMSAFETFGNLNPGSGLENIDGHALRLLAAKNTDDLVVEKALEVAANGGRVTEVLVKGWKNETQKPKAKKIETIEGDYAVINEIEEHYEFFKRLPREVLVTELANLINDTGISIREIERLLSNPIQEVA
jgi:hypothetical protein